MSKRIAAAVAFLRRWAPHGPHVLTALCPDQGFVRTRAFTADSVGAMAHWIEGWQRGVDARNIYFCPNPDRRPPGEITTKARKEHIAAAVTLHAVIDAYKAGEDLQAGQERVLRMLTQDPPPGVPGPPTSINLSGNGYNAFWRLRTPIVLDGNVETALEVERYNRGLAIAFGADMATDVCRVLRLPWTINFPNKRKRARRLRPVLARQVSYDASLLYELEDFPAADATTAASGRDPEREARIAARIEIGRPVSVAHLDELEVPERTKIIIATGGYPGEQRASRSEWLFAVIMSMIRAGERDETILGVITDPAWAIGESVLEKADPQGYARYQIGRAHARLTISMENEFDD